MTKVILIDFCHMEERRNEISKRPLNDDVDKICCVFLSLSLYLSIYFAFHMFYKEVYTTFQIRSNQYL